MLPAVATPLSSSSVITSSLRFKTDAKPADTKKKVQPLSFGVVTRVKDGVAFARDLGFASFGELVIFVPSPARLKTMQQKDGAVNYVDGMIVGLEKDLTSVVILGNERLVKVSISRISLIACLFNKSGQKNKREKSTKRWAFFLWFLGGV